MYNSYSALNLLGGMLFVRGSGRLADFFILGLDF